MKKPILHPGSQDNPIPDTLWKHTIWKLALSLLTGARTHNKLANPDPRDCALYIIDPHPKGSLKTLGMVGVLGVLAVLGELVGLNDTEVSGCWGIREYWWCWGCYAMMG